jgi:hypothetical protein
VDLPEGIGRVEGGGHLDGSRADQGPDLLATIHHAAGEEARDLAEAARHRCQDEMLIDLVPEPLHLRLGGRDVSDELGFHSPQLIDLGQAVALPGLFLAGQAIESGALALGSGLASTGVGPPLLQLGFGNDPFREESRGPVGLLLRMGYLCLSLLEGGSSFLDRGS